MRCHPAKIRVGERTPFPEVEKPRRCRARRAGKRVGKGELHPARARSCGFSSAPMLTPGTQVVPDFGAISLDRMGVDERLHFGE